MSLTKNEERLLQWSVKNAKALRDGEKQESYWKEKDMSGDGVVQYNVETLKEMQVFLENAEIEPELALIFGAETMKQKTHYFQSQETQPQREGHLQMDSNIPDYVYRF